MLLDYSSGFHYLIALAPEVIVSIWATVILLMGVSGDKGRTERQELAWLSLVGLAVAALANGWLYTGVHEDGASAIVAVDHFRLFANWVLLTGAAMAIMISPSYVSKQKLQAGEYFSLILFSTVGMMFMASARELMLIFLGLELMSIAVYALTGFNRRDRRSAEAGLKYFLLGAFASGFLLFGIALIYGATGSTNLSEISSAMATTFTSASTTMMTAGLVLLAIGFAFKVAAVPFHMWTPDVYEGAPTPVTAFMAASVKTAAFVAFLRVFVVGLDAAHAQWVGMLTWLAAITMIVGNLVAVVQANVKRMLAYSSIAHGGYLMVALVAANSTASAGLLFYLLVYSVMTIGTFAVLLAAADQSEGSSQIESFSGFANKHPYLAVVMTILLLSLAGFPGTGGFMAKIHLLQGAAEAKLWTLAVVLVLTTVVSYWYYLRVAWFMWMKSPPANAAAKPVPVTPFATHIVLIVAVTVVLLTGFFPSVAVELAESATDSLRAVAEGEGH